MIKVLYDGKCGLCNKEISYYKKIANNKIFKPYLKSGFNADICNEKNVYKFSSLDWKKNVK